MATCSECDTEIDVDEFDVDRGDQLSCPECGSNLQVGRVSPVELEPASEDDEDEDEDEDKAAISGSDDSDGDEKAWDE